MKKTAREKRGSARVSHLECTRSPRPVDRGRPQCPVSYPDNNSASHLFRKLSATPGGCERKLVVSNGQLAFSGQPCDLSWAEVPESLACMDQLDAVMATVQDTRECNGCSFEKYGDLVEKRDGVFLGKDKEVVATIDKTGQIPCIRAYRCSRLLPRGNSAMCSSCKSTDNTLRSAH